MDMMPLFAVYGFMWTFCFINMAFEIERIRKILEKKVNHENRQGKDT